MTQQVSIIVSLGEVCTNAQSILETWTQIMPPETFSIYNHPKIENKTRKYNGKSSLKKIVKAMKTEHFFVKLMGSEEISGEKLSLEHSVLGGWYLSMVLELSNYLAQEAWLLSCICQLMADGGRWAMIHDEKDLLLQNGDSIHEEADFRDMEVASLLEEMGLDESMEFDVKARPCYGESFEELFFAAHWKMWFSPAYSPYVSQETLLSFQNASSVKNLGRGVTEVTLYPNVWEPNLTASRQAQYAFKEHIHWQELLQQLHEEAEKRETKTFARIVEEDDGSGRKIQTVYYSDEKE